mgnify:CR=1 FL=1
METRKIQRVGNSSGAICLPYKWLSRTRLKHGDLVSIFEEDDGSIRIYPGIIQQSKKLGTTAKINISKFNLKERDLTRVIVGCYIVGHDIINLESDKDFEAEQYNEIWKIVQRIMGIFIIESLPKKIILQCFIDSTKFTVREMISRLQNITITMLEESMRSFITGDADKATEVLKLGDDKDKIYYLAVRQILQASTAWRILHTREKKEPPMHIVGSRVIVKDLEEIGDSTENIASETLNMVKYKRYKSSVAKIDGNLYQSLVKEIITNLSQSVESLQKEDFKIATEVLNKCEEIKKRLQKSVKQFLDDAPNDKIFIYSMTIVHSNLMEINKRIKAIAEVAINRLLETSSQVCTVTIEKE